MRIALLPLFVDDQDRALAFYTGVLGFKKRHEFPVGPYKWLTVLAPEGPEDVELALEPNANPAARTYQEALFEQKIPAAAFKSSNVDAEYERLAAKGVVFTTTPTTRGPVRIAVFSDTCGNLIQLFQPVAP
jgi:catechol 2,3-dioxygenase-like lactoylglutathione lyase family enzyme